MSVEADMAELEIGKEDAPRQKEMEKECYEEEVQTHRKTHHKPIIYETYITLKLGIQNSIFKLTPI